MPFPDIVVSSPLVSKLVILLVSLIFILLLASFTKFSTCDEIINVELLPVLLRFLIELFIFTIPLVFKVTSLPGIFNTTSEPATTLIFAASLVPFISTLLLINISSTELPLSKFIVGPSKALFIWYRDWVFNRR